MKVYFIIVLSLFLSEFSVGQDNSIDSVKFVVPADVRSDTLLNGIYLVMELADEETSLGFLNPKGNKGYIIGKNAFFDMRSLDSVCTSFNPLLNAEIITIRFNHSGALELRAFTGRWKGHKVGIVLSNRLIMIATLDAAPIDGGKMSIATSASGPELEILVNRIKAAATR